MIRALCLVCRDYLPSGGPGEIGRRLRHLAQTLASRGCAVHVITAAFNRAPSVAFDGAVVVHRISPPEPMQRELDDVNQLLWAAQVAEAYRQLDAQISFDVVIGSDMNGETARIETARDTALVIEIHRGAQLIRDLSVDPFCLPVRRSAAELALTAVDRADLIISPDEASATMFSRLVAPEIVTIPPPLRRTVTEGLPSRSQHLELCHLGDLEPDRSPELAIAVLANLRSRAIDAHLTMIGRDRPMGPGGESYRRSVLLPILRGIEGGLASVRFIDSLSQDELDRRLRSTDFAVQPDLLSSFSFDAITLMGSGVSVLTRTALSDLEEFGDDEGSRVLADDDKASFAERAFDHIDRMRRVTTRGEGARDWVWSRFDADQSAQQYLDALESVVPSTLSSVNRRPAGPSPRLALVMLIDAPVTDAVRAASSLFRHTEVPFTLTLVADNDVDLSSVRALDPRIEVLSVDRQTSPGARRNRAIDHCKMEADFLVLVDDQIEVVHRWWTPFVAAFDRDQNIGIVSESGVTFRTTETSVETSPSATGRCDSPVDCCLFIRRSAIERVGTFEMLSDDPSLNLSDFALRARRAGELTVALNSGMILQLAKPPEIANPRALASNRPGPGPLADLVRRYASRADSPFLILADLDEVASDARLLERYASAFCAHDEVALTLWRQLPGGDAEEYLQRIGQRAAEAGLDLEHGPRIHVILPDETAQDDLDTLARVAHCVLSTRAPTGALEHLAWFDAEPGDDLRILAARVWAARHRDPIGV